MKIGQELVMSKDSQIQSALDNKIINIKKGDKAIVVHRNKVKYLTGEARGYLQLLDKDAKGYDHANIANFIVRALLQNTVVSDLDDVDEINDIAECIEDTLFDIL